MKNIVFIVSIILTLACGAAFAQTTEFSYQGNLKNGAAPATGNYDFEFALFDSVAGGIQVGAAQTRSGVSVADGTFSVKLDFGSQFPGSNRFLEIRVRQMGGGAFTSLTPRQAVTSSPYSVTSLNATNASNALQLGGIPANQFLTTTNANANYIQNTTNQQLGSNFNLSGNGTLGGTLTSNAVNTNVVDAANQYNISGIRVLSIVGSSNLFVGENTGFGNTTGGNNSFVGPGAGFTNSVGGDNAYFGTSAGQNATGSSNSFFGMNSGTSNTLGSNNTLIGKLANVSTGNLTNVTAIGANSLVSRSNSLVLGSGVNVGIGTSAPNFKLHLVGENLRVEGNTTSILPRFSLNFTGGDVDEKKWQNYASSGGLIFSALNDAENDELIWLRVNRVSGIIPRVIFENVTVAINTLGTAGATALCRNASNQISTCSSSVRYKQNINPFNQGLSLITQLRPVSFNWRANNQSDLGLVAEEVAAVEPLLTTVNEKGEVEGVKYDRVGVVLINAVGEQQDQIEALQMQIKQQRSEIDELKAVVCAQNPGSVICVATEKKP